MVLLTSPPFVAVNLAIASPKSTGTFSYLIKICCRTKFHVSICHHTQSTLIVVLTSLTSTHLPRPGSHQPPTAPHYSETTNGDVYKRYSSPFRIPPPTFSLFFFLRKNFIFACSAIHARAVGSGFSTDDANKTYGDIDVFSFRGEIYNQIVWWLVSAGSLSSFSVPHFLGF